MTEEPEYPEISSFDDLVTLEEFCEKFHLTPTTAQKMRFQGPINLPYIRIGRRAWFSKTQVIWYLNTIQRQEPDKYYIDRKRRLRAGLPLGSGRPPKLDKS